MDIHECMWGFLSGVCGVVGTALQAGCAGASAAFSGGFGNLILGCLGEFKVARPLPG
jgi:hypothetical protein